jgi:hypothetical protein
MVGELIGDVALDEEMTIDGILGLQIDNLTKYSSIALTTKNEGMK